MYLNLRWLEPLIEDQHLLEIPFLDKFDILIDRCNNASCLTGVSFGRHWTSHAGSLTCFLDRKSFPRQLLLLLKLLVRMHEILSNGIDFRFALLRSIHLMNQTLSQLHAIFFMLIISFFLNDTLLPLSNRFVVVWIAVFCDMSIKFLGRMDRFWWLLWLETLWWGWNSSFRYFLLHYWFKNCREVRRRLGWSKWWGSLELLILKIFSLSRIQNCLICLVFELIKLHHVPDSDLRLHSIFLSLEVRNVSLDEFLREKMLRVPGTLGLIEKSGVNLFQASILSAKSWHLVVKPCDLRIFLLYIFL